MTLYPKHGNSHLDTATEAPPRELGDAAAADLAELSLADARTEIALLKRQLEVERRAFDTLADHSVEQSEALGRAFRERDAARVEATEWRRVANGAASASWLPPFEADRLRQDIERIRGERDHFRQQLDARADDVEARIAEAVRQERERVLAWCEDQCMSGDASRTRAKVEIAPMLWPSSAKVKIEKPSSGEVVSTAGGPDSRLPRSSVGTTSPSSSGSATVENAGAPSTGLVTAPVGSKGTNGGGAAVPPDARLENWLASQAVKPTAPECGKYLATITGARTDWDVFCVLSRGHEGKCSSKPVAPLPDPKPESGEAP